MRLLIFAFLAVFPFGQLGRLEIAPTVNLHLLDIFAGMVGLAWLLGARKLPKQLPFRPMIVFGVVASFSLIVGANWVTAPQALVGGLYLLRWFTYTLFLLAVAQYTSQFGQQKKLLDTLLLVGAAVAAGGVVQYFLFPDIRPLALAGWDPHYYRLVGTFLDAGFVGILLVFFTLLALSRVETRRRVGWGKQLILPAFGVITVAMTFSRASYLALVVGLLAFYIVRRNVWIVGGALALLVLTVAVLPRPGGEGVNLARTTTVIKRLSNYQQSAQTAAQSPLFGVGFNLYRYRKAAAESQDLSHAGAGSDSSILFVAATTGIVGLIAFLNLWGKILQSAWSRRKSNTGLVLLTSSAALLAHSTFDNSLFYPWVLGWMWILVASNIKAYIAQ